MKSKINTILDGGSGLTDVSYAKVAREMPDVVKRKDRLIAQLKKPSTPEERLLASNIRTTCIGYRSSKKGDARLTTGYSDDEDLGDGQSAKNGGELGDPDDRHHDLNRDENTSEDDGDENKRTGDNTDEDESDEEDAEMEEQGFGEIDPALLGS